MVRREDISNPSVKQICAKHYRRSDVEIETSSRMGSCMGIGNDALLSVGGRATRMTKRG